MVDIYFLKLKVEKFEYNFLFSNNLYRNITLLKPF